MMHTQPILFTSLLMSLMICNDIQSAPTTSPTTQPDYLRGWTDAGGQVASPPPTQTVVEVPNGANLVPLLKSAKSHTTFNCRGKVTSNAQMILISSQNSVWVDGCGTGSIVATPGTTGSAIFSAIGTSDFRLRYFDSITCTTKSILVDDEGINTQVTHNRGVKTLLQFVKGQHHQGLLVDHNVVDWTGSVTIFTSGNEVRITNNTLAGSFGESTIRCVKLVHGDPNPTNLFIGWNQISNPHGPTQNFPGKQPLRISSAKGVIVTGNVITGPGIRISEPDSDIDAGVIDIQAWDNTFKNDDGNNAFQFMGLSNGNVWNNIWGPGCTTLPFVAIAKNQPIKIVQSAPETIHSTTQTTRSSELIMTIPMVNK